MKLLRQLPDCCRDRSNVVVVSDVGVMRAGHVGAVTQVLIDAGVAHEYVDLDGVPPASSDAARLLREALGTSRPQDLALVAVGGGSVIDVVKFVARSMQAPWLLDGPSVLAQEGLVEVPGTARPLPLVAAAPTRYGTASEHSAHASISPCDGAPRRLFTGQSLIPDVVVTDLALARHLPVDQWIDVILEIVFRFLGPFLVTERSSEEVDQEVVDSVRRLVRIGRNIVASGEVPGTHDQEMIIRLSMLSATGRHVSTWEPAMPPWWCIQNTLLSSRRLSKGQLTARALPILLTRIGEGDAWLGHVDRLARLRGAGQGGEDLVEDVFNLCGAAITEDPGAWASVLGSRGEARLTLSVWGRHSGVRAAGVSGIANLIDEVFNDTCR